MPRTGGLLSNSRRTTASGSAAPQSRNRDNQGSADLPPYESPSCPIDKDIQGALTELSNNRSGTRAYEKSLTQSAKHLATSVGQINENLHHRKTAVKTAEERRQKKRQAKSAQDERIEDALAKLQAEVPDLTTALEASMRQVIDRKADLEDEKEVFQEVVTEIKNRAPAAPQPAKQQSRRKRRGRADSDSEAEGQADADGDVDMGAEEDEEEEERKVPPPAPIPSTTELLKKGRAMKRSAYERLGMAERYSSNNDYIAFKRTWHDALYLDEDTALPDPSDWFDADGNPVVEAAHNDSDDDLVVAREVRSLKCPLSMVDLKEPYSSDKCKHTFEKAAILEYLGNTEKDCPQTGCSAKLRKKDMFLDEAILRKIKYAADKERRKAMEDATSDVEPDEDVDNQGHDSEVRVVKAEARPSKSSRREHPAEDYIEDD